MKEILIDLLKSATLATFCLGLVAGYSLGRLHMMGLL